ncbi:MAG: hypothetical protein WC544_01060 [Patescibacteria group bacterium]
MAAKPKKPNDDTLVLKQRIFAWTVVFVLMVLACSVMVYFLFINDGGLYKEFITPSSKTIVVSNAATNTNSTVNSSLNTNAMVNTIKNTGSVSNSNAVNQVDVENWQHYTNSEFGYAFNYPQDWAVTLNDNTHATVELNPTSIGYSDKLESQLTVAFATSEDLQSSSKMYVRGITVKKGTKYVLYGQDTVVSIPYGNYFIEFSWPVTIMDDSIQQAIVSTFTFTGEALVKERTTTLNYRNDDVNVSFDYPSAWWPVVSSRWYSSGEGGSHIVNFYGSSMTSFNSRFSLFYNTIDFAPGREGWQGEQLSAYDQDHGLQTYCDQGPTYQWSYGQDIRDCTTKQINGKWTVEYLTRLDALGGGGTIYFVKVFAFQTDNPVYPVGVLSVFLPDSNNVQLPNSPTDTEGAVLVPQDVTTVDTAYAKLVNKTADAETNTLLAQFDGVVKTFSYSK